MTRRIPIRLTHYASHNCRPLAIVFCFLTLPTVQADIVEFHTIRNTLTLFDWGNPDDGTLDNASETWSETFTAGSGDYSYDVELTISTNSGSLVEGTGGDLDVANEELHTFTLSVSDFMDLSVLEIFHWTHLRFRR